VSLPISKLASFVESTDAQLQRGFSGLRSMLSVTLVAAIYITASAQLTPRVNDRWKSW